jgi:hypothetical protein
MMGCPPTLSREAFTDQRENDAVKELPEAHLGFANTQREKK